VEQAPYTGRALIVSRTQVVTSRVRSANLAPPVTSGSAMCVRVGRPTGAFHRTPHRRAAVANACRTARPRRLQSDSRAAKSRIRVLRAEGYSLRRV
jgi:hypothetical protein